MTNRTLKDPIGSTSSNFENSLRQRRDIRIRAFTETNRYTRDWINFAEIAEWCSEEDGIRPNEAKRAAAYDSLERDLLAGEFVEGGRSRVLYLHRRSAKVRMTPEWLKDAIDHNLDGENGRLGFLPLCWISHPMLEWWIAKHRLQKAPLRFQPRQKPVFVENSGGLREFSAIENIPAVKSLNHLPKLQIDIVELANQLWPTGKAPSRVKERNQAIQAKFEKNPPSERTIRRALKDWP
jgi:hypothetical protein